MWKTKAKQLSVSLLAGIALLGALLGVPDVQLNWPQKSWAAEPKFWTTLDSNSNPTPDIDIANLNQAFTSLAKKISPAVVNIYTKTRMGDPFPWRRRFSMPDRDFDFFFNHPFGGRPYGDREAQALGSGFVINKDGYIVTNAHVVRMAGRNADEIMVQFIGESLNSGHQAKIVGVDEVTDVALLKLEEKLPDLVPAPLGNSDRLQVGEWVVAIGNPYGHTHTFTEGVVSALGRSIEGLRTDFIQTSASINPGNSGGPLVNLAGEVVAINTAIDPRAQGIGFAIPINSAKEIITQLMTNGRVQRAWLGIGIHDAIENKNGSRQSAGVIVREVVPRAPAAKAGIRPFDVITKINGQEVKSTKELTKEVEKLKVGQEADLEVWRNGKKKTVKVQIEELPSAG